MRQILLDTETTGLLPSEGHRVIEIAALELVERQLTGVTYHQYLNPERPVDPGARAVHGLDEAFLADKPRFAEIVKDFMDFISGAELIIHNAAFDVGFLNHELNLLSPPWGALERYCQIFDTLTLARRQFPGKHNSLDALCERYHIDHSARAHQHGALLDAQLLAQIYLAMTAER